MKAAQAKDLIFRWEAPAPLSALPTVGYTLPGGAVLAPVNMVAVRTTRSVSAIGADRRTLTLTAGAASVGLIGPMSGRGFLTTDEDGTFSVTIDRLDGTTAILADLLPRGLALTSPAMLSWSGYEHTLPAADTATRGALLWTVAYTPDETPTDRALVDQGTIFIVRSPFDTGLTHSALCAEMPQLADMIPRRQQDLSPQITGALDELVLYVRDNLLSAQTEDDIFNPRVFLQSHQYLAAARVYEMSAQLDIAERMRERALNLFERAMRQLTLDTDDDGVIDAAEINLRREGGRPSDFRGTFALPGEEPTQAERDRASRYPQWTGMRH